MAAVIDAALIERLQSTPDILRWDTERLLEAGSHQLPGPIRPPVLGDAGHG